MRLEDITAGIALNGLEPSAVATVVAVVPIATAAVQVIYKTQNGTIKDRLLNRADEPKISIATTERPWSFEGEGEAFKLTVEAKRIDLAFLFDPMMAVHTSNVDPLPHQITAVYESMLPRQPLRFVLADDPGAGKTIMAGLYIRELIMRADARRILIVAPGSLIHPGHPLMLALSDVLLEQHANLLRQGTILVDPTDEGDQPSLLFLLTHEIKSGDGQIISKRLQFVRVLQDGSATFAGWAPHLDLEPLAAADRPLLAETLAAPWLSAGLEQRALALAASSLVPEHFSEIAGRRIAHVDKTLAAVHERLTKEIDYWSDRFIKLTDDMAAGRDVRLNLENVRRTLADLEARLESRKKELQSMRHVTSATPVALSGALVVPAGLLHTLRGEPAPTGSAFSADPEARSRIDSTRARLRPRIPGLVITEEGALPKKTVRATRRAALVGCEKDQAVTAISGQGAVVSHIVERAFKCQARLLTRIVLFRCQHDQAQSAIVGYITVWGKYM